jgi:hypothetical protein
VVKVSLVMRASLICTGGRLPFWVWAKAGVVTTPNYNKAALANNRRTGVRIFCFIFIPQNLVEKITKISLEVRSPK